jgi:hypothetical protein
MGYVICIDLQTNSSDYPVKIHRAICKDYLDRKLDAKTMSWSQIFETRKEAESIARRTGRKWKWAECVKARTNSEQIVEKFEHQCFDLEWVNKQFQKQGKAKK